MPVNAKQLYEALKADKNYEGIGSSFESFQSYFSKPENAQQLYQSLKQDKNYDGIGSSLESFQSYFGLTKKDSPQGSGSQQQLGSSAQSSGGSTGNAPSTPSVSVSGATVPKSNPFFNDKTYAILHKTQQPVIDNAAPYMGTHTVQQAAEADMNLQRSENIKAQDDIAKAALTGNPALIAKDTRLLKTARNARRTELAGEVDFSTQTNEEAAQTWKHIDAQVDREQNDFSARFYDGKLTGDDISMLRRGNPIGHFDMIRTSPDADALMAQQINQKTKNLADWASSVRNKGVMDYAKTKEELEASNQAQDESIANWEGRNSIRKEGGKWVAVLPEFQSLAESANRAEQTKEDNNTKIAYIDNQFRRDEYARDKQLFDLKMNEKLSALHGGKSIPEIMQLLDEGKDAGGFLKLGVDGKLSAESARELQKLTDEVINENKLDAIRVQKYGTAITNNDNATEFFDGFNEGLHTATLGALGSTDHQYGKDKGDYVNEYKDVLNRLNYNTRGENAQKKFDLDFAGGEGAELAPLLHAKNTINEYFGQEKIRAIESGIKASQDAAVLDVTNKYDQQLRSNPEYLKVTQKWQQAVVEKQLSPDIAQKHIEADLYNNQALKGIIAERDKEINAIQNKANQQRMQYMADGVKQMGDSNLVVNPDGTLGVNGVPPERMRELLDKYNDGSKAAYVNAVQGVAQREGRMADVLNIAGEYMYGKGTNGLVEGFKEGGNGMMKSVFRWLYHKTGHGLDNMQYFQSKEEESQNVGDYAAKHFKYNGLASLVDPAYYAYSAGQSAPYMLPTMAVGLATGGSAAGVIAGGLFGGTLETATNALNTYTDVYENGTLANGMPATEKDASRAAAKNFAEEILPNIALQALEFRTLLRASPMVKPVLNLKTIGGGLLDIAESSLQEGVQEGLQGYIQNNARANGIHEKSEDLFDYLQTDDFRQNFFGGLAGGVVMGAGMKPMGHYQSIKQWNGFMKNATAEMQQNFPYSFALSQERAGNGDVFRDGLRLGLLNEDYKNESEKTWMERTLKYSESLRDNLKAQDASIDLTNRLYAAHNLALSDLYEKQAKDNGGKAIAKVYQQKANQLSKAASAAMDGEASVYFVEKGGMPVFISPQSAEVLLQEKKTDGLRSNDTEFNERVKQAQAAPAVAPATNPTETQDTPTQPTTTQPITPVNENQSPANVSAQEIQPVESPANANDAGDKLAAQHPDPAKTYRMKGDSMTVKVLPSADGMVRFETEDGSHDFMSAEDFHHVFEEHQEATPVTEPAASEEIEPATTEVTTPASEEEVAPAAGKVRGLVTSKEYKSHPDETELDNFESGDRVKVTDSHGTAYEGTWSKKQGGVISSSGFSSQGSILISGGQIENLSMQQEDGVLSAERKKNSESSDKIVREARRLNDAFWHEDRTLSMKEAIVAARAFLNKHANTLYDHDEEMYNSLNAILEDFEHKYTKTELRGVSKRGIAARIREFADKMEAKGQGGLYSSIIPITPKQLAQVMRLVADAIDTGVTIAQAVAKGVQFIKDKFGKDVSPKDLADEVEKQLFEKPKRETNETMAEYAMRVLAWRKSMLAGTTEQQAKALSTTQDEMDFIKDLNKGIELFRSNEALTLQEFNKQMGLPVDSYETYVAVIKYFNSSNKQAAEKLEALRKSAPRQVMMAETDLLRMRFQQLSRGARMGYNAATKEVSKNFRNLIRQQEESWRNETAEKTKEMKKEHRAKLQELRNQQKAAIQELKDKYQDRLAKVRGIRVEIQHMLNDYNEAGLFDGVQYSKSEILKFASMVNAAMTEKAFDNLQAFMDNLITKVDYGRRILDAKQIQEVGRKLLSASNKNQVISAGDIRVLKELLAINPTKVDDLDIHIAFLKDAFMGRFAGSAYGRAGMTNQQYEMHIAKQQAYELNTRAAEIMQKAIRIQKQAGYALLESAGKLLNFPTLADLQTALTGILSPASGTSYDNKVAELDRQEDILNWINKDMRDTFSLIEDGVIDHNTATPLDYNEIAGFIEDERQQKQQSRNNKMSNRDELENIARDMQASMVVPNPNLTQEQNDALQVLKEIDVEGMTANELRLLMNVVDAIVLNGNLDGVGRFKAIHEGQQVEVKNFLQWLEDKNYKVRRRIERGAFGELLRGLKSGMSSTENVIVRIANNATSLATQIFMVTQVDRIKTGYVKARNIFQEMIGEKLKEIDPKTFDRQNPDTNVRMTMLGYLSQYEEGTTPEEQQQYFNKRLQRIKDDIAVKQQDTSQKNKKESVVLLRNYNDLREKIQDATGVDIGEIGSSAFVALDSNVFNGLNFLTPSEQEVYEMVKGFHAAQRPAFMEVSERLLNKRLKMYANYTPDNTRALNGGAFDIDVIDSGGYGGSMFNNATSQATGAFNERIDGWQIVSGEGKRVLDYNWFKNQMGDAMMMLVDIHTMEHRMVSDEVFKNKTLIDEFGADNVKLLKATIVKELRSMTGLTAPATDNGAKALSATATGMVKMAAKMNLYSANAYIKQSVSALGNTATFLQEDAGMVGKATKLLFYPDDPRHADVEKLISTQEVWLRGENGAGTQVYGQTSIKEDTGRIGEDGLARFLKSKVDFINGHNNLTGETKSRMRQFLENGDILGARGSWVALYASSVVKQGLYQDFDSIDWAAEAAAPNREAAAFAQTTTSRMLNANSRHAHGGFYTDPNAFASIVRGTIGLFGSFGWNKAIGMTNSLQSYFSKNMDADGRIISDDQRKEERGEAMRVVTAGIVEDIGFQLARVAIGSGVLGVLFYAGAAMLAGLAGNKEDEEALWKKSRESFGKSMKALPPAVLSNYFFSIAGSEGQAILNDKVNDLINLCGGDNFFYEGTGNPNMPDNQGLFRAAFGNTKEDVYRLVRLAFFREDRFGAKVDSPTKEEFLWSFTALLSNLTQLASVNDADMNRMIHKRVAMLDRDINERYKDKFWIDASESAKPRSLALGDLGERKLDDEQSEFYYQKRQAVIDGYGDMYDKAPEHFKRQMNKRASDVAKGQLMAKYGQDISKQEVVRPK